MTPLEEMHELKRQNQRITNVVANLYERIIDGCQLGLLNVRHAQTLLRVPLEEEVSGNPKEAMQDLLQRGKVESTAQGGGQRACTETARGQQGKTPRCDSGKGKELPQTSPGSDCEAQSLEGPREGKSEEPFKDSGFPRPDSKTEDLPIVRSGGDTSCPSRRLQQALRSGVALQCLSRQEAQDILTIISSPTAGRDYIHFEMPPLAPATAKLVLDFAKALADKLHAAEVKYGYGDDWSKITPSWPTPECHEYLMGHVAKGDPRDVANFCAFLWFHKLSTKQCLRDYIHKRELEPGKLAEIFAAWPLPESVCSDQCVTDRCYPHRSGTNLLTIEEARQMFEYVLIKAGIARLENREIVSKITAEILDTEGAMISAKDTVMGSEQAARNGGQA